MAELCLSTALGWCTVSASNFEVSKLNLRESRAIFFHLRGIPAALTSIPAGTPHTSLPHPRDSREIRGIPVIPIPVHISNYNVFFHGCCVCSCTYSWEQFDGLSCHCTSFKFLHIFHSRPVARKMSVSDWYEACWSWTFEACVSIASMRLFIASSLVSVLSPIEWSTVRQKLWKRQSVSATRVIMLSSISGVISYFLDMITNLKVTLKH